MASSWWDVCQQGTKCLPWNPGSSKDAPDWGVTGERSDYGVPLPQGTAIQAPVSGVVLGQHPGGGWYSVFGQQSFGGEIDILSNVPEYGGLVNVGVIHMDTASVQPGQVVQKGQVIGTSGGQTSGGHWPSSPKYSSGPHVGLQVHNIFNWGDLKDPGILMSNLWAGKDTSSVPTKNQLTSANLMQAAQAGPAGGCNIIVWFTCHDPLNPSAGASPDCQKCFGSSTVPGAPSGNIGTQSGTCAPWDIQCIINTIKTNGMPMVIRIAKFVTGAALLFMATLITFLPEVGAGAAIAAGVPEAAPAVSQALGGRRRIPQTRTGAAVQAWSIFAHHGQQHHAQGRANVAAAAAGQQAPYPAAAGAPGQPPYTPPQPPPVRAPRAPRAPRGARAGAAPNVPPNPPNPAQPNPANPPNPVGGRGRRAAAPPNPPNPAPPPTPTPTPVQTGGPTQPLTAPVTPRRGAPTTPLRVVAGTPTQPLTSPQRGGNAGPLTGGPSTVQRGGNAGPLNPVQHGKKTQPLSPPPAAPPPSLGGVVGVPTGVQRGPKTGLTPLSEFPQPRRPGFWGPVHNAPEEPEFFPAHPDHPDPEPFEPKFPSPRQPKRVPSEPPRAAPKTVPLPPEPAQPPRKRTRRINPFSPEGREAARQRRAAAPARGAQTAPLQSTVIPPELTFEEALARVREAYGRPDILADIGQAGKRQKPEGQSWSDFFKEK